MLSITISTPSFTSFIFGNLSFRSRVSSIVIFFIHSNAVCSNLVRLFIKAFRRSQDVIYGQFLSIVITQRTASKIAKLVRYYRLLGNISGIRHLGHLKRRLSLDPDSRKSRHTLVAKSTLVYFPQTSFNRKTRCSFSQSVEEMRLSIYKPLSHAPKVIYTKKDHTTVQSLNQFSYFKKYPMIVIFEI